LWNPDQKDGGKEAVGGDVGLFVVGEVTVDELLLSDKVDADAMAVVVVVLVVVFVFRVLLFVDRF
jgi:hypothetical protein